MNGKNLLITSEAHTALKIYCAEKDSKLTKFASMLILDGLERMSKKESKSPCHLCPICGAKLNDQFEQDWKNFEVILECPECYYYFHKEYLKHPSGNWELQDVDGPEKYENMFIKYTKIIPQGWEDGIHK
jgi:hypothetical protein